MKPIFALSALLGLAVALWLGLRDYETKSVWQLFNAENAPFMALVGCFVFSVAVLIQLLAGSVLRAVRQRSASHG